MPSPFNSREGLAIQSTGLKNPPNATMAAVEQDDEDDISLTSTVESVFQDEYEVETIHAQDIINGQKVYLVKWKGYEDLRCTWEPRNSFNTKEILQEWKNKKQQIRRGTRQPFDVEAWQAEIEAFENARQDRKRRRRAKRARLGLLGSDDHDQETTAAPTAATPITDVEMTVPPPAPLETSSDDATPLAHRRDLEQNDSRSITDSIRSKSPSQPRSTPPTLPTSQPTIQSTLARPISQTARRTERPKAPPPKPVDIKVVDGRIERKDLAGVLNRARQQPKHPTEKSKPWKLFQTTHRFEKASKQDPEPNRKDLELQSPSTWSPFQMSSFLRKRQEKEDSSLFVDQDEVPETQQTSLPQTPAALIDSHVLPPERSSAVEQPSAIPSSTIPQSDHTQEVRGSPSTESSDYHVPKGPKGWKPLTAGKRQLRKKEDMLCQILYGTEPVEIGDALLCDLSTDTRDIVNKLQYKDELKVRFEEICTLDHFQLLAHETRKEVSFNGFILPYSDTKSALFGLEQLLLEKDLVAIARISPYSYDSVRGLTFVCYPNNPRSKSFQLLNRQGYSAQKGSLCFAGIKEVLPSHPREIALPKDDSMKKKLSERPERQGRFEDSMKIRSEGLAAWRPPSQSIPSTPRRDDSFSRVKGRALQAHDPRLEVSSTRSDQEPATSRIAQSSAVSNTAAAVHGETTATYSNVMDTSSDSSEDIDIITGTEAPISNEIDVSSPAPVTSNEQYTDQVIPETQDVQMLDVSNAGNIDLKEYLANAFLKNFKMTYDDIAAVTSHSGIKLANCFYLWFPEDADADFLILEKFLDTHDAIVLSNRKQKDWEKFTKSSSGIALFHHSFLQFSEMPGFHKLTMSSSFNFWTVSLATVIPNIEPQTHFQRIFPHGTGYLITEDFMLHERDAAIMVIAWFRDIVSSKFPGTLKMMFRPNVLKWLDRMSKEDPRFAVMAVLIGDTACHGDASNWPVEARDLDCFHNPSLESPVISLAELPNAGPAVTSSVAKASAEQSKDTDLLCEVFAAWAILNAASLRKFLILTHNKPLDRWQAWQHVEIIQGATDFFRKSNISKDHYTKWLAQGSASASAAAGALSSSKSATATLPTPSSAKHSSKTVPVPASASTAATASRPGLSDRAAG